MKRSPSTLSHVVFPTGFSTLVFLEFFFFFWCVCPGGDYQLKDWGFWGFRCGADVMGDSPRLVQTATDWSALKPESLSNFTRLNAAISLCMRLCGGGGAPIQLGWRTRSVGSAFPHIFMVFTAFPSCLASCNASHVRGECGQSSEASPVCRLLVLNFCH